jgi:hypothetical protein
MQICSGYYYFFLVKWYRKMSIETNRDITACINFNSARGTMQIEFHGANKNVTGSCHLVKCNSKQILVDCGMYQGGRDLEEENSEDFGFDPADIDYLILTHAHLDHCGRIPLLVKRGFRGKIVSTPATRELARLVMLDSARLQEDEAEYKLKRAKRHGNQTERIEPLYNTLDALNSLDYFTDITGFRKAIPPGGWDQHHFLRRRAYSRFSRGGNGSGGGGTQAPGSFFRRPRLQQSHHPCVIRPGRRRRMWWSWRRPMATGCIRSWDHQSRNCTRL